MLRSGVSRLLSFTAVAAGIFLTGCSPNPPVEATAAVAGMSGSIHGGQQPISGATIQLYAVGTAGDGSPAAPLLTQPVVSNSSGNFNISGLYTCPSASTLVYLTGTGGSPTSGITNPEIALMAALGPCGSLTSSTFINVNELTTVAAVYTLAPFITSYSAIGSGASDAAQLALDFTYAGYFASTSTGTTPGTNLPANYSVPVVQVNTIADILASCINSPGGVFADRSVCGQFFFLTHPSGGTIPTDTVGALLNLANNPSLNTTALYNLITPNSPFQPVQSVVPYDLSLKLVANSAFTISPATVDFSSVLVGATQATQTITVTNATSAVVSFAAPTIAGPDAFDYSRVYATSTDCVSPIPANSTCTFQVSFVPSTAGVRSAYFVLSNTSADSTLVVPLTGQGLLGSAGPVTLTPTFLAFNGPATQTLTLTNSGATPLTITSITSSDGSFGQTNNCGSSLAAMSFCTINVSFGAFNFPGAATLTVVDDAATGPQIAGLASGGGGAPSAPSTVAFGGWAVGATGSQFFSITGPSTYGSYELTITGPNASDFSFSSSYPVSTSSCSYEYRFSMPCNVSVYFSPSAVGARSATLNIIGFGVSIPLTGTGDPTGVDFGLFQIPNSGGAPLTSLNLGSTLVGTPVTAYFSIVNTGTVTPLSLKTAVISGPNAAAFTVNSPGCTLGCSPTVTYTPTVAGAAQSATLSYTDTSSKVTHTLALSGTATTPAPVVSIVNPYFSNVPVGSVSAPEAVTITAYNNDPVTASLVPTYTGGPASPFIFTQGNSCAATPCTLMVAYAPTTATGGGVIDSYLNVTDTVGQSTGNVQLIGSAAPLAEVSVSPLQLNYNIATGTSMTQTLTLFNEGTIGLDISGSLSTGSTFFTLVNNCTVTLAPGATCTMNLTFAPTGTASQNYGTITISAPQLSYTPTINVFALSF